MKYLNRNNYPLPINLTILTMFSTQTNRNDPSYDLSKHSVHNSIDEGLVQAPNYRYPHTLTFLNDFTAEAEAQIIQNFEALNSRAGKVILPNLKTLRDSFCVSRVNDRTMAESGVEMKDGTEDSPYLNLMDNDHTFDENDVWLVVERQQTEGWFIYIKDLYVIIVYEQSPRFYLLKLVRQASDGVESSSGSHLARSPRSESSTATQRS